MILLINTTMPIIEQSKWSLLMLINTYLDFDVDNNDENPKFKIGDHV